MATMHITGKCSSKVSKDAIRFSFQDLRNLSCVTVNINTFSSLYLLTYSMQQSPSWEANWSAASQEIPRILWNPNVHYRIHKCPPSLPILSQLDTVHAPTPNFLRAHFNIILIPGPTFFILWQIINVKGHLVQCLEPSACQVHGNQIRLLCNKFIC